MKKYPGRVRIEQVKPLKPSGRHRGRCMAVDCRRAGRAGLCDAHQELVMLDIISDIPEDNEEDLMRALMTMRPSTRDGYVLLGNKGVHRYVMEAVLGRALYPGENVHHKNGVRFDNSPENLELWVTSQPSGQRPDDLVEWAHTILDRYGPKEDREAIEASKDRHPSRLLWS